MKTAMEDASVVATDVVSSGASQVDNETANASPAAFAVRLDLLLMVTMRRNPALAAAAEELPPRCPSASCDREAEIGDARRTRRTRRTFVLV